MPTSAITASRGGSGWNADRAGWRRIEDVDAGDAHRGIRERHLTSLLDRSGACRTGPASSLETEYAPIASSPFPLSRSAIASSATIRAPPAPSAAAIVDFPDSAARDEDKNRSLRQQHAARVQDQLASVRHHERENVGAEKQMAQRVVRRVRPADDAHARSGVVDQEVGEIRDADDVASRGQPRGGEPRLLVGLPPLAEPHDVAIVERRRALDRYRGAHGSPRRRQLRQRPVAGQHGIEDSIKHGSARERVTTSEANTAASSGVANRSGWRS